jgi:hypothetical protein
VSPTPWGIIVGVHQLTLGPRVCVLVILFCCLSSFPPYGLCRSKSRERKRDKGRRDRSRSRSRSRDRGGDKRKRRSKSRERGRSRSRSPGRKRRRDEVRHDFRHPWPY